MSEITALELIHHPRAGLLVVAQAETPDTLESRYPNVARHLRDNGWTRQLQVKRPKSRGRVGLVYEAQTPRGTLYSNVVWV